MAACGKAHSHRGRGSQLAADLHIVERQLGGGLLRAQGDVEVLPVTQHAHGGVAHPGAHVPEHLIHLAVQRDLPRLGQLVGHQLGGRCGLSDEQVVDQSVIPSSITTAIVGGVDKIDCVFGGVGRFDGRGGKFAQLLTINVDSAGAVSGHLDAHIHSGSRQIQPRVNALGGGAVPGIKGNIDIVVCIGVEAVALLPAGTTHVNGHAGEGGTVDWVQSRDGQFVEVGGKPNGGRTAIDKVLTVQLPAGLQHAGADVAGIADHIVQGAVLPLLGIVGTELTGIALGGYIVKVVGNHDGTLGQNQRTRQGIGADRYCDGAGSPHLVGQAKSGHRDSQLCRAGSVGNDQLSPSGGTGRHVHRDRNRVDVEHHSIRHTAAQGNIQHILTAHQGKFGVAHLIGQQPFAFAQLTVHNRDFAHVMGLNGYCFRC